jgi:hypothetical protein
MPQHYRLGEYHRVADHLYRYSATKKYYAVFKSNGKTKWIPLNTADRQVAGRKVKETGYPFSALSFILPGWVSSFGKVRLTSPKRKKPTILNALKRHGCIRALMRR